MGDSELEIVTSGQRSFPFERQVWHGIGGRTESLYSSHCNGRPSKLVSEVAHPEWVGTARDPPKFTTRVARSDVLDNSRFHTYASRGRDDSL